MSREVKSYEHEVKVFPELFQPMLDGIKPFDVRVGDRGYQRGSVMHYREWDPNTADYTGRGAKFLITFTQTWGGVQAGHVALGLKEEMRYNVEGEYRVR